MARGLLVTLLVCALATFAYAIVREGGYVDGVRQGEGSLTNDPFATISDLILNNKVVVFSKSYCPYVIVIDLHSALTLNCKLLQTC